MKDDDGNEWNLVAVKRPWIPDFIYKLFSWNSPIPFMRNLGGREPWRTFLHWKLPVLRDDD